MGAFCASSPYQSFSVFLRPVTEDLGWSREAAAASFGTMALLAAAAAAPVGRLLDRYGVRRIVLPSLTALGVAVASMSMLTPSLTHFYLVSAVVGLATVGTSPVAYSRAIFSWFDVRRGRALGLMLAGPALAQVVMPGLATMLIGSIGWRGAWLTIGIIVVAAGVPIVAGSLQEREAAPTSTSASGARIGEAIRSRLFWTLIAVIFGSGLLISGFIVHGAALLTDRSFTVAQAALVISIYGASNLSGRLLTGALLDRYSAPRVAAVLLMVLAGGGLLLSRAQAMETAIAAAILVGLGAGGEMDINPYLLSRYFGMRSLSTLYGFNWMALGIASTIGPVVMGRAYDATRSYESVLVTLALVTIGAAALMLTLPAPSRGVARRPDDEDRIA
ncbi:MAG TPA: MFS transporter [Vicinamibacterales bacterium]|nr:MFS transporter [Vicinamibacterales bacterium]